MYEVLRNADIFPPSSSLPKSLSNTCHAYGSPQ